MVSVLGRSRRFDVRVCISLPQEYVDFLRGVVEAGEAESISQAVRKCIGATMERFGRRSC
ncbi:MAG: ribbon-helix-helix protein, CopG family [Candidatus Bathyarchaeia archaeon]